MAKHSAIYHNKVTKKQLLLYILNNRSLQKSSRTTSCDLRQTRSDRIDADAAGIRARTCDRWLHRGRGSAGSSSCAHTRRPARSECSRCTCPASCRSTRDTAGDTAGTPASKPSQGDVYMHCKYMYMCAYVHVHVYVHDTVKTLYCVHV